MLALAGTVQVPCDTKGCPLPIAYLKEGMLIIASRHHGKKHVSVIRLTTLLDKIEEGR